MLNVHSCPSLRWRRENWRGIKKGTEGIGENKKKAREVEGRGKMKEGQEAREEGEQRGASSLLLRTGDRKMGPLSPRVRQNHSFFLGCLASWIKIGQLNDVWGTGRWRGM